MELMELGWPVLLVVVILAAALLFTPYEAVLEGVIELTMVTAVLAGFLMHPRRDLFYVRTAVQLIDADRNQSIEHDFLAVRVELVKLWLLFAPTVLAVASLVFFRGRWAHEAQFLELVFFIAICVYTDGNLAVPTAARSSLNCCVA